jgi:hypothetical protein
MTARVVNLRLAHYDVYIGRPGRGERGIFGNPIRVDARCSCGQTHRTRGETLPCFEVYLRNRLAWDTEFRRAVLALDGKVLGCFCKDANGEGPCHGDVYVKVINELRAQEGYDGPRPA